MGLARNMYQCTASQGSLPVLLSASVVLTRTAPVDTSATALMFALTIRSPARI